jgi:allantoicase
MGSAGLFGKNMDGLENPGDGYLVVVAKNGPDDKPDRKTLRAFSASASQGIMYDTAIWRKYIPPYLSEKYVLSSTVIDQPMVVFDKVSGCQS